MNSHLVSCVIVNFNGGETLEFCLASLFNQPYSKLEVTVVDNGSSDNSLNLVRDRFPKIKIIANRRNLGFARACNQGVEESLGDYIFFLNSDATVKNNTISALISLFEKDQKVFACQPKILKAKTNLVESEGFYFTWFGFFYYPKRFEPTEADLEEEPKEIFGGTGAALMVDKKKFLELGGFDSDFFLYSEDADLAWRARSRGYKIFYQPTSLAYHQGGIAAETLDSSLIIFHSFKNRILVLLKNLQSPYLFLVLPIHLLIIILWSFFYFILLKPKNSLAILAAIGWNVLNINKTLVKRRRIQIRRIIKDSQILSRFSKSVSISYAFKYAWQTTFQK